MEPAPPLPGQRRKVLAGAASALLTACSGTLGRSAPPPAPTRDLPFANGRRHLVAYPEKRPLLVLTSRPPQLETPFEVFNEGLLTPNDAFFVRYHHAGLPTRIDGDAHVIRIAGPGVAKPYQLSVKALRTQFVPVELVAVNQCSGNGRGLQEPRVTGGQMGNGAMGNARWRGVPLKEVLARAEPRDSAREVAFNGLDGPLAGNGDYVKSLPMHHAMDGEVMLAYEMNGEELPMLNGYPVRLVVPGFYGTYWIKHLSDIEVLDRRFEGFWMDRAYRIPDNDCACVAPGTLPPGNRPIGRFNVRSFITSLRNGDVVRAGELLALRGIAFDGGQGIREVVCSTDGGQTWRAAGLGPDLGRYSFREFLFPFTPTRGTHDLCARAWNRAGHSQPMQALWQPAGYMRNVVERLTITAT